MGVISFIPSQRIYITDRTVMSLILYSKKSKQQQRYEVLDSGAVPGQDFPVRAALVGLGRAEPNCPASLGGAGPAVIRITHFFPK